MANILAKLNNILLSKIAISGAIEAKGISVNSAPLSSYADLISQINTSIYESDIDLSATTALPSAVLSPYVFYKADGNQVTGSIQSKASQIYTPGLENQTITAGQYLSGDQIILGDANLIPSNIISGVTIFGIIGSAKEDNLIEVNQPVPTITRDGLTITASYTPNAGKVVDTTLKFNELTLNTIDNYEYTPSTQNQTIETANKFLTDNITILGDPNLAPSSILSGVTIFGVSGNVTAGVDTSDANATTSDLLLNKTAYVNGTKITGTITSKSAQTYTPGTEDQTITAGQYLNEAQTIKGDANLVPSSIVSGVTIFGVEGTYAEKATEFYKCGTLETTGSNDEITVTGLTIQHHPEADFSEDLSVYNGTYQLYSEPDEYHKSYKKVNENRYLVLTHLMQPTSESINEYPDDESKWTFDHWYKWGFQSISNIPEDTISTDFILALGRDNNSLPIGTNTWQSEVMYWIENQQVTISQAQHQSGWAGYKLTMTSGGISYANELTTNLTGNAEIGGIYNADATQRIYEDTLIPTNIKAGTTILGVSGTMQEKSQTVIQPIPVISINNETGIITASYTPVAGDVSDITIKSATESLQTQAAQTINPTTSNQTILAGKFLIGDQTILGDANLVPSSIVSGVTIFGVSGIATTESSTEDIVLGVIDENNKFQTLSFDGTAASISGSPEIISQYKSWNSPITAEINVNIIDTSDANATLNNLLYGKTAYVKGQKITGTILTVTPSISNNVVTIQKGYIESNQQITVGTAKSAQTYTPGTSNQTIAANSYLLEAQTILGDANLVPSSILSGVTIFGVSGTVVAGVDTSDANAVTSSILSGYSAYVNGLKINGSYVPEASSDSVKFYRCSAIAEGNNSNVTFLSYIMSGSDNSDINGIYTETGEYSNGGICPIYSHTAANGNTYTIEFDDGDGVWVLKHEGDWLYTIPFLQINEEWKWYSLDAEENDENLIIEKNNNGILSIAIEISDANDSQFNGTYVSNGDYSEEGFPIFTYNGNELSHNGDYWRIGEDNYYSGSSDLWGEDCTWYRYDWNTEEDTTDGCPTSNRITYSISNASSNIAASWSGNEIIVDNNGNIVLDSLATSGLELNGFTPTIGMVYAVSGQSIIGIADTLAPSSILSGVTIFGVSGTVVAGVDTSDANAIEGDLLQGKSAYVNGSKITGTITSKSAQTYTPGTTDQTITAGQYLNGVQTIKGDANLVPSSIINGVTIFGVTGTNQGSGNGSETYYKCASITENQQGNKINVSGLDPDDANGIYELQNSNASGQDRVWANGNNYQIRFTENGWSIIEYIEENNWSYLTYDIDSNISYESPLDVQSWDWADGTISLSEVEDNSSINSNLTWSGYQLNITSGGITYSNELTTELTGDVEIGGIYNEDATKRIYEDTLIPANIKAGTTILGVSGTMQGAIEFYKCTNVQTANGGQQLFSLQVTCSDNPDIEGNYVPVAESFSDENLWPIYSREANGHTYTISFNRDEEYTLMWVLKVDGDILYCCGTELFGEVDWDDPGNESSITIVTTKTAGVFPYECVVSGADISDINGTYTFDGEYFDEDCNPVFTKIINGTTYCISYSIGIDNWVITTEENVGSDEQAIYMNGELFALWHKYDENLDDFVTTGCPTVTRSVVESSGSSVATWSGQRVILSGGIYTFEENITSGLIYSHVTPIINGIYSENALIKIESLYTGNN